MPDTISVASKVHTAVKVGEPLPDEFKDKPGEAPELQTLVLNGSNHPDAKGGEGITHNVDAGVFHRILDGFKNSKHPWMNMFREVSPEEARGDLGKAMVPPLDAPTEIPGTTRADVGEPVTGAPAVPDRSEPPVAAEPVVEPVVPVEPHQA